MASGYFGWTEDAVAAADAVEIKIGQGAKPGLGGVLPAAKVTERIAEVRGIEAGVDSHSPSRFPDIGSPAALAERLERIRSINPGIPIGIKIVAGRGRRRRRRRRRRSRLPGRRRLRRRDRSRPGARATTSASRAGWRCTARAWLDDHGHADVQLVVTGGYGRPDEMARRWPRGRRRRSGHRIDDGDRLSAVPGVSPRHLSGRHRHAGPELRSRLIRRSRPSASPASSSLRPR